MPLRSVKMNRFIFGFHRRVWCPKWTPLSSSWRMVTTVPLLVTGLFLPRRAQIRRRLPRLLRPAAAGCPDAAWGPADRPGRTQDRGSRLRPCLLYTSDAADEEDSVDLGGRRIIKKKKHKI